MLTLGGGMGGERFSVTGTVTGELVAPEAVMVMTPLYVPVAMPAVLAETVDAAGAVPPVGLRESQGALLPADQVSVPLPVLVMLSVWLGGLASPAVPLKVRLEGLAPMVGC